MLEILKRNSVIGKKRVDWDQYFISLALLTALLNHHVIG